MKECTGGIIFPLVHVEEDRERFCTLITDDSIVTPQLGLLDGMIVMVMMMMIQ